MRENRMTTEEAEHLFLDVKEEEKSPNACVNCDKPATETFEDSACCLECFGEAMEEIDRTAFGFDPTPCEHGKADGCRICEGMKNRGLGS